ncbi:MAG TPA: UPF0182 family protein, partial [Coleofasciculaceae cyanobacterium]
MKHCQRAITTIALLLILAIVLSKTLVHLLTEAWWFGAIEFASVFWTRLTWQVLLWCVAFVAYNAFLWGTYRLAMRNSRTRGWALVPTNELQLQASVDHFFNLVAGALILFIALIAAASSLSAWETVLKYLHPTPFGKQDPIFQHDLSFYLFQLPLYEGIRLWLLGLILPAIALATAVYLLRGVMIVGDRSRVEVMGSAKAHLSLLLGTTFLLVAWGFWLDRYRLLTSSGKVVFGASYTDVHARLWAYLIMGVLSLGVALLFFLSMHRRSFALPVQGLTLLVVAFVILNGVYPWFVQQFIVNPNELTREKPYIQHNIQFTQAAYHLNDVKKERYAAIATLNRQSLQNNQPTVRNIRLWDYRPLLSTYKQLQEIRLYYTFTDVDVDRYTLNNDYQQVMLSARELSYAQLPQEAQTWVNQRLKYTHGYGLVMSP